MNHTDYKLLKIGRYLHEFNNSCVSQPIDKEKLTLADEMAQTLHNLNIPITRNFIQRYMTLSEVLIVQSSLFNELKQVYQELVELLFTNTSQTSIHEEIPQFGQLTELHLEKYINLGKSALLHTMGSIDLLEFKRQISEYLVFHDKLIDCKILGYFQNRNGIPDIFYEIFYVIYSGMLMQDNTIEFQQLTELVRQ